MRIVFFGTPELAISSLSLLREHHDVVALVCQPDKPQGRNRNVLPPPTKQWAVMHGIPVVQPEKLNDGAFEEWLRGQNPEICPLVAYGRILRQALLDVPIHGFINLHPSLLPKHRGPSPIQSALLNGDTVTGVTVMKLNIEMDAGDIILQKEDRILPNDNADVLSRRLGDIGASMMLEAIEQIAGGQATYTKQDHAQATYCRLFAKSDGYIRWRESAQAIHNRVRAANPWPMAQCWFRGEVCRVLESDAIDSTISALPGTVTRVEKERILVATGDGLLAIKQFQAPGKKPLAMSEYLRGRTISVGDHFVDL